MRIFVRIIFICLTLNFISCKKEEQYINDANRIIKKYKNESNDLEKTLRFFAHKDPEKLKAAYILISNLERSISITENPSIQKPIDLIQPFLKEKGKTSEVMELFNTYLDSLGKNNRMTYKMDVELVTSNNLIENIELAYKSVSLLPHDLRPNESLFYNYVLPYKSGLEPLEVDLRKNLLEEYGWIHSVIKKNKSLESGVCALLDTLKLNLSQNTQYQGIPKVSQTNKIGFGTCSNLVALVVQILRSLGIPATTDFIESWGNHTGLGHEWLVFFANDTEYAIDVFDYRQLNNIYEYASMPKIYRKNLNSSFNVSGITCEDVTKKYKTNRSANITFEETKGLKDVNIGIFDVGGNWRILKAPKEKIQNDFLFRDVGNEIIYVAEITNSDEQKIKYPFFLNTINEKMFLVPDYNKKVNAVITRKYPPSNVRNNGWKESWVESIASSRIMGANKEDLSDALELYKLDNFNTYNPIMVDIQNDRLFKYYFLEGGIDDDRIHVAEFYPVSMDGSKLHPKYQISAENTMDLNQNFVSDDNSLTFLDSNFLRIVLNFDKPEKVRYFKIQARNDDNNVKPNDEYELLYWKNNGWKSLGRKVANDTVLYYNKIPSNAIYWLKNHTRGKEEHVFLLDSLGRQYWPGVTSMKRKLENYWFCSQ